MASSRRYISQIQADRKRSKTRVNIAQAFERWCRLKEAKGLKSHAEVAVFLLDIFEKHSKGPCLSIHTSVTRNAQPPPPPSSNGTEPQSNLRTSSKNRPEPLKFQRRESTDTCDSMDCESPWSSSNEDKQETCAASAANRKAPGKKVAAPQKAGSQDRRLTIKLSQNEVNRDIQGDEHEEIRTTLTVGDGRYTVDLGSSSEFIVDEECILQMFKSCWECNKQCSVRKRVQGLKIVVNQACYFCESRFTWTNLPDADEDDGGDQINGQTNTATSRSSNTS